MCDRGEDVGNVVSLTFEDDRLVEAEPSRLGHGGGALGTISDERGTVLTAHERKRPHERDRVLRRLEATDRDDHGHPIARKSARARLRLDTGVDHERATCVAGAGGKAARRSDSQTQIVAVVSGRTARSASRGIRAGIPVCALAAQPCTVKIRMRNAGETRGDPSEDAGLRATGMDDLRTQASQEERQLDDTEQIPRRDRATDMAKRDEVRTSRGRDLSQRAWPVRADGDVVVAHEPLDELCHIR